MRLAPAFAFVVGLCALCCAQASSAQSYLVSDSIDVAGSDLVFDPSGNPHVAGVVRTYNYPGIDSGAVTNAGYGRRFVSKVDLATRKPLWVAVVGAAASRESAYGIPNSMAWDEARGLALDSSGNAYLVAYDGGTNFPVTGGSHLPSTSKHVFRVSGTGQVTRLSPPLDSAIRRVGAIAMDGAGNIYLTGSATSGLLTSPGAPFPASSVASGCRSPFVLKLDPTGQTTVYSTYLGYAGVNGERCGNTSSVGVFDPTGYAIALDSAGNAIVGGQAEPGVRATSGAVDFGSKDPTIYVPNAISHASHAFVSKLNPAGTAVVFSARLGGSERDRVTSIALDSAGAIYVGGKTSSGDFPRVPGAAAPVSLRNCPGFPNAPEFGFVTKLSANGTQIVYSVMLPVYGEQLANCYGAPTGRFYPLKIALDSSNRVYAVGTHDSERVYTPSPNAINTLIGPGLFYVIAMEGQGGSYSTPFPGAFPDAAALDPFGHFWAIGSSGPLTRLSVGTVPIEIVNSSPLCAPTATLTVRVAGANSFGTVDFVVDGVGVGTSSVQNGIATKAATLIPGVRRVRAVYHGSSYFDGVVSEETYVAVNQAGACQ